MAVGMLFIRFLGRYFHTNQHNQSAEDIRGGMHSVADHRAGVCNQTGSQLQQRQHHIGNHADQRNPRCRALEFLTVLFSHTHHLPDVTYYPAFFLISVYYTIIP